MTFVTDAIRQPPVLSPKSRIPLNAWRRTMALPYASPPRRRYQPVTAYALAEKIKRNGIELAAIEGPWRVAGRTLQRPGRNRLNLIPLVTNGRIELMVDTMQHAADLSGFLNWCGVENLNPVADLTPPPDESLRMH